MNQELLTKENVLAKVDSSDLLNYYLKPFHSKNDLKQGEHISNPFLNEVQKTPSFNIYHGALGLWRYKDFATGDDGDVFDLIMQLKSCDFKEALSLINQDFCLGLGADSKPDFNIEILAWSELNLKYWSVYGISRFILEKYNVIPIQSYERRNKSGELMTIDASANDPIYSYRISSQCYKLYRPYSSNFKFSWLGQKPLDYVFGKNQLPLNADKVFITGGEKDVLSLSAHGINAICLNSETASPSKELIDELKSRFKEVFVLYDLDDTGKKQSQKVCEQFGLKKMNLPDVMLNKEGKDVSDFFKLGYNWNDFELEVEDYSASIMEGDYLQLLLNTQQRLNQRKSEEIKKVAPILTHFDEALIYPRTINIIQGKAGVHKSRLAETI